MREQYGPNSKSGATPNSLIRHASTVKTVSVTERKNIRQSGVPFSDTESEDQEKADRKSDSKEPKTPEKKQDDDLENLDLDPKNIKLAKFSDEIEEEDITRRNFYLTLFRIYS